MAEFNLLAAKLKAASQEYYTTGEQTMSDEVFDSAQKLLQKHDPKAAEVSQVGWGYDVGQDSTPGEKFKHTYGLVGSLGKAYSWDEVNKDLKGKLVDVSLKLDGLSMVLYYESGVLVRAVTRGDGVTGIDVTNKILKVLHPKEVHLKDNAFTGAVRGEILMTDSNWNKFKALHPEAKNSRNATAGLINAKDVREDLKYLTIVVYKVIGSESKPSLTMPTMNVWLQENFSYTAPHAGGSLKGCDNFKELSEALNPDGFLPTDGLVMKLFDMSWDESTGEVKYTEQAYKFAAEVAVTEVEDVEWNLTKNRLLVPRVKLQTVHISGTNVSYATGYNADYIATNHIGLGAVVSVEKHGEIIPNINEVLTPSEFCYTPYTCPCCGTKLEWEGVHLKCPNEACGNAKLQDLLVWVNNLGPVDNFGDTLRIKYLTKLLSEDNLDIDSLMKLRPKLDNPQGVQDGLCNDMLEKVYEAQVSMKCAIQSLNIPRIANSNADKLVKFLFDLMTQGHTTLGERIEMIGLPEFGRHLRSEIGDANATAVLANMNKLYRLRYLEGRIIENDMAVSTAIPVAVTGKLSVKRSQFEDELKKAGYVIEEVSARTTVLITDDPNSGSSKNQKADKLGIKKMTEAEFRAKYLEV